jgi:FixJ family two-component response regulator
MTYVHASLVAVVDDDIRVLESIESLLESAGHSVLLFSSAQALLGGDKLPGLDCLITDIGIPVIDGFELRQKARLVRPDLPVIFITGRHEPADQKRAAAGGHQGFFRKPFDASALLAAVAEALLADPRGEQR